MSNPVLTVLAGVYSDLAAAESHALDLIQAANHGQPLSSGAIARTRNAISTAQDRLALLDDLVKPSAPLSPGLAGVSAARSPQRPTLGQGSRDF